MCPGLTLRRKFHRPGDLDFHLEHIHKPTSWVPRRRDERAEHDRSMFPSGTTRSKVLKLKLFDKSRGRTAPPRAKVAQIVHLCYDNPKNRVGRAFIPQKLQPLPNIFPGTIMKPLRVSRNVYPRGLILCPGKARSAAKDAVRISVFGSMLKECPEPKYKGCGRKRPNNDISLHRPNNDITQLSSK